MRGPRRDRRTSQNGGGRRRSRLASSVSIIVLPTKWICSSCTPERRRLRLATSLVVKNQLLIASVTRRLICSGIVQSPERMPPSTCATGTCSFCAAIAQAHGRGHVAHHQAQVARRIEQQPFVARHDRRRLLGLRALADLEIHVGRRDAELREEVARHACVVVLAGVYEAVAQGARRRRIGLPRLDRADDGRDLH